MNETSEREQQSTYTLSLLQEKLKDFETALNLAKSESDDQALSLNEDLVNKEAELNSLREELKAKEAANCEIEFQIRKYVCRRRYMHSFDASSFNCCLFHFATLELRPPSIISHLE